MNDPTQSTNTPSVVDPGILEMGASVSVNDELRRNITAETMEIDNTCAKLVSDITTEDDRAKEMEKSKRHSDKEQSGLIQSTREMSETNHMNTHIFCGLQSRVDSEICFTPSPKGKSSTTASNGGHVVTPTDIKLHSPTSVFAIQQTMNENKENISTISKKLGKSVVAVHNFKNEFNEMVVAKKAVYQKVKSERLKVVLANAKHKVQMVEDILKDKQMHHHAKKVNCDMMDTQNKLLQDTSVALECQLVEKKKGLVELEDNVGKLEAKIQDLTLVMTNRISDLNKELKYFDDKVTQLSTTVDKAGTLIKSRDDAKDRFDHLRVDRGASFTSKMSLQSEITAMHKKLEDDRRTIHNETILAETIAKPMQDEIDMDLNSKKAELEVLINKEKSHTDYLKAKSFPGKSNVLQRIEEKKEELGKMKDDISRTKLEMEEKCSKLKEHKRLLEDHREEYETFFEKLKAQIAEEKETYVALERQIQEANTNANPDEYGQILRNAKLYKYAAKILQTSIAKEKKLAEMSVE